MSDEPNVIPFGKHKGKTIEEVQTYDPQYLDWLTGQPWFRDRFVVLHQTIINRGAEPEETPDHNALQVLFLDDAFCLQVVVKAGYNPPLDTKIVGRTFEAYGIDVRFCAEREGKWIKVGGYDQEQGAFRRRFAIEIKPSVGDDYPAVLRQMMAIRHPDGLNHKILFLERYIGVGATVEQFKEIFKAADISIVFRDQVQP